MQDESACTKETQQVKETMDGVLVNDIKLYMDSADLQNLSEWSGNLQGILF